MDTSKLTFFFFPQIVIHTKKLTEPSQTLYLPLVQFKYFSVRVINHWNQLHDEIVNCTS